MAMAFTLHRARKSALYLSASLLGIGAAPALAQGLPNEAAPAPAPAPASSREIRFRADSLNVNPVLAVALADGASSVAAGGRVQFRTYCNYPAFIMSAEIRVFRADQSSDGEPVATITVNADGEASWQVPATGEQDLFFVLRVTAADGSFDETRTHALSVLAHDVPISEERETHTEFGAADEASTRTIALAGVMATVTGRADPVSEIVRVSGQRVPIANDGRFAAQQIVAREGGALDLVIARDGREVLHQRQDIVARQNDWFVVAQGEVTLGHSFSSGPSRVVSGDSLAEGSYALGRAAIYAKGSLAHDTRITASLDTGEARLGDLLSNFDRKDPHQLLRRLDATQFYPTYGDDSTLIEDAPTQGRFYLRAQRAASQLVIGNFTTQINGGDLVQLDRGLFGALVDVKSTQVTSFGERKAQLLAFASDPGTVPAREEFRGTGGSLYFLRRQDVSIGSERVRVEVRDRETGLVLESRDLFAQQDYDFDPMQGRLTLLKPLSSLAGTSSAVRESSSAGNVPVLVVRYEYTPSIGSLDGYTIGGRGSIWLGETLRIGATAQRDTTDQAAQTVIGGDTLLRLTAGTYLKSEIAQSKGPGFGQSNSVDGGLSFTDIASPGTQATARAWRSELAVDFAELAHRSGDKGRAAAYYEHQDAGFAANGRLSASAMERWGISARVPFAEASSMAIAYDELWSGDAGRSRTGQLDLAHKLSARGGSVELKSGLRYEERVPGLLYNSVQDGRRIDGALEAIYAPLDANWALGAFAQATLAHDATRRRNNRFGVTSKSQITQRLSFTGELSGGDGGLGADLRLNHRLGDGAEAYLGYALLADRSDTGTDPQNLFSSANRGSLVVGSRQRFSDAVSVHGENRIGMGGSAPSMARNFGLTFTPDKHVSVTSTFENGWIDNAASGRLRRTAGSLGLGYSAQDIRLGSTIEIRRESGTDGVQTVWLMRNTANYALDPDWRALGEVNLARADVHGSSIAAAQFTQIITGLAWRPAMNNRLNALLRAQYYEDLGPVGQLTGSGQSQSPKQASAIVNVDMNYDLSRHVTLGAKYGYRQGKVSLGRESDEFVRSDAHLAILRADYHVARAWDVLAEGRALWVTQASDMRLGALAAAYRHIAPSMKVGLGYSWSDFSDDLTDQSYSSHGPFLNVIATM